MRISAAESQDVTLVRAGSIPVAHPKELVFPCEIVLTVNKTTLLTAVSFASVAQLDRASAYEAEGPGVRVSPGARFAYSGNCVHPIPQSFRLASALRRMI